MSQPTDKSMRPELRTLNYTLLVSGLLNVVSGIALITSFQEHVFLHLLGVLLEVVGVVSVAFGMRALTKLHKHLTERKD